MRRAFRFYCILLLLFTGVACRPAKTAPPSAPVHFIPIAQQSTPTPTQHVTRETAASTVRQTSTPIPSNTPRSVRPSPTPFSVVIPVTATPRADGQALFQVSSVLPTAPGTTPTHLAAWSPDGSYILYQQLDEGNRANVYRINVQTGEQKLLVTDAVAGLQTTNVFYEHVGAPQWLEPCCTILMSKHTRQGYQQLEVIDIDGNTITDLGEHQLGPVFTLDDGRIIVVEQGQITSIQQMEITRHSEPISGTSALASVAVSPRGMVAYTPRPDFLKVYHLDYIGQQWTIDMASFGGTKLRKVRELNRPALYIESVRWSPDGEQLAFWISDLTSHELWLANADGSSLVQVAKLEQSRGGELVWSPTGEMLAITDTPTGTEAWKYQSLGVVLPDEAAMDFMATGVYSNPIWDPTGKYIAILYPKKSGIALYEHMP